MYLNNLKSDHVCYLDILDKDPCNNISEIEFSHRVRKWKIRFIHIINTQNSGAVEILLSTDSVGKLFIGR